MTIFRSEVIEARKKAPLAELSISQSPSVWALSIVVVATAVFFIVFCSVATYTRKHRVEGRIVPAGGLMSVLSADRGVIERVEVAVGDIVSEGDPLLVVSLGRRTEDGDHIARSLRALIEERVASVSTENVASEQRSFEQRQYLSRQLDALKEELELQQSMLLARREALSIADSIAARMEMLSADGFVSQIEASQHRREALNIASQVHEASSRLSQTRRQIAEFEDRIRESSYNQELRESGSTRELALLQREKLENYAQDKVVVIAPASGEISDMSAFRGRGVDPGSLLMSIIPDSARMQAELDVSGRAVSSLELGTRVRLRYEAFPYQKFGYQWGTVSALPRSIRTADLSADQNTGEPIYKVVVDLDSQEAPGGQGGRVLPGMIVEADIMGERRTLLEWLIGPSLAAYGEISGG